MSNQLTQFVAVLTGGSSGVPVRAAFPLKQKDGHSFRLRHVEFRQTTYQNVDVVQFGGVSPVEDERVFPSLATFMAYNKFMAFHSWGFGESGTTGESATILHERIDLWDLDYRVILPPTLHIVDVGSFLTWNVVIAGEYVKVTEGQRNAIIAWQGGVKGG